jgi:HEAT repeat protein
MVFCAIAVVETSHYIARKGQRPDYQQQICATLVCWGSPVKGIAFPVCQEEIDQNVDLLSSDLPEQRVQAAAWLGSRGVQGAGPAIAASMRDERTYRPCQLAHNLGLLGDDRWVELLADATKNPTNADLRICATLALGELGSSKAVDALIDAYHRGVGGYVVIDALGKIADPSSLEFLRSVAQAPRNRIEHKMAAEAIQRVTIMQLQDPVPALIDRVRSSAQAGPLDAWAVRKLVGLEDRRVIEVFKQAFLDVGSDHKTELVTLAAGMLAQEQEGLEAIRSLALELSSSATRRFEIAQAACDLGSDF